jgi:hypothetical protein
MVCTEMDEEKPFVVEGPSRIRLGKDAKEWAQVHGMTIDEMAEYLVRKYKATEGQS